MKKILALVLAAAMMMTVASVFAATNDTTPDTTLKITGLDEGDTVNIYQVLEWVSGTGWSLLAPFNGSEGEAVLAKIQAGTALTQEDVVSLSSLAAGTAGGALSGDADSNGVFEVTSGVEPGMYIALVAPVKADTVYNPIIVSADFNTENGTNEIDSSAILGSNTSVAKKSTVTVEKTANDYTHASNADDNSYDDPITFTITTTIPAYSKQYTAPIFNVKDKLSTGLELIVSTIAVSAGSVDYTLKNYQNNADLASTDKDGFTVVFDSADILDLAAPQAVTITYQAYLTNAAPYSVNEEDNDVTVIFSHDPNSEDDVKEIYDKTRHYTFSIDGELLFNSSYKTGEVVKIGKDSQGNVIESYKELSNGTEHGALPGAVFGLYPSGTTEFTDANLYKNSNYPDGCKVTTDEKGLMEINGLDVGTYILKEISAPDGYIKDQNPHTIVITADIDGDEEGETGEKITENGYEYYVPVLRSYTVTVDGTKSTYNMTLDGPEISSVTPGDSSSEIVNTKGVELPSTGGIGTTLFYLFGGIMVLAAGVVLVARRKAEEE